MMLHLLKNSAVSTLPLLYIYTVLMSKRLMECFGEKLPLK